MQTDIQENPQNFCDMKLKGLLETLEIEFRQLLQDSHSFNKKKYPQIKESLDAAIEWIKNNKNKFFSQIDDHLTPILDVFFAIVETKQAKMYSQMLNTV
jgi:hypothetical protein